MPTAEPSPQDTPPHDQLADLMDQDDWNPHLHGRMLQYADDTPIPTETHTSGPEAAS